MVSLERFHICRNWIKILPRHLYIMILLFSVMCTLKTRIFRLIRNEHDMLQNKNPSHTGIQEP